MKLRNLVAVLGLAGGVLLAGQAQALFLEKVNAPNIEIDTMDFRLPPDGNSVSVSDSTADGIPDTSTMRGSSAPDASPLKDDNGVWVNADGTRQGGPNALYVNLLSGDNATTDDCGNCRVSHTTARPASLAHHFFTFRGDTLTANAGDIIGFEYETDIDNGDFFLTFSNDGEKVGDTFQWSDVAATGLTIPSPRPLLANTLQDTIATNFAFNDIRLDVFSNGGIYTDETGWLGEVNLGNAGVGLDTNIGDDVPEPSILALLSVSLLGLGWLRRRAG